MPRLPRSYIPDGPSHVFSRGIRYEEIFLTEGDATDYLDRAAEAFARFGVECWCYCLMPNHYHWVLYGRQVDKSAALHRLNSGYAQSFNRRHGFRGHLFGDRHGVRPVVDEAHLLEVVRYVVLNPVRAGLCDHPRQWRWSSYAATVGLKPKPSFLELRWMNELLTPQGFEAHVAAGMAAVELPV